MRTRILAGALLSTIALAACGGGTSGVNSPVIPSNPKTTSTGSKATFVVTIPPKRTTANSARSRKYISANVQAVSFNVSQNGHALTSNFYPVSASQPYCSAPPLGGLVCTLAVGAPPGSDLFTVNTYDAPTDLLANIISTGTVTANITNGTTNTINVATSGVPTLVEMSVDNPFPAAPISEQIHMLVADADGNMIVGPYDAPVTLSNSDTTGTIALSLTSLSSAADAGNVTATYNGAVLSSGATITANVTGDGSSYNGNNPATMHIGPQAAGVVSSPSFLQFVSPSDAPQMISLSGVNGGMPSFFADTNGDAWADLGALHNPGTAAYNFQNGCSGIVSVTAGGPPNTYMIAPVAPGVCDLDLSDSVPLNPNHGYVAIVVQSSAPLVGATPAPQFPVSPSQISLTGVGSTGTFQVTDATAKYWTWSSSNTNVATVASTPGGLAGNFTVTAVGAGQSLITVTDDSGNKTTVTVTVTTTSVPVL